MSKWFPGYTPYGYPPFYPPPQWPNFGNDGREDKPKNVIGEMRELMRFCKTVIAEEKRKGGDKKKEDKPKTYSISEMAGYLFIFSPVIVGTELLAINYLWHMLNETFK